MTELSRRGWAKGLALAGATTIAAAGLAGCVPPQVNAATHRDHRQATRTVAWDGGERLWVGVSAEVHYTPGPANTVVITGPRSDIDDIVVEDGGIHGRSHWGWWQWHWSRDRDLRITVTTPRLSTVGVSGSGSLDLGQLNQDSLEMSVSGSGHAKASGAIKSVKVHVSGSGSARLSSLTADTVESGISGSGFIAADGVAKAVDIHISGSGRADLGGLATDQAKAMISGSGSAKIAPKQDADLSLAGSGGVQLVTEPQHLSEHKSGSGWIHHPNEAG